jgi:Kef-type K+ transport system membrane component KefB
MSDILTPEVQYILLIVGLFVVPRVLQRFRIPSAIACVGIGAFAGMGLHAFHDDTVVPLFATLGIVALFLFAGLEVDVRELRRGAVVLGQHLVLQILLLAGGAWAAASTFDLAARPAILFALAVLTPSTGFILDSLGGFGLDEGERFWVRSKAIATELVALVALFVTVQSKSASSLTTSAVALIAMVVLLPGVFRFFARVIAPFAPKTEFTFLLITALVCSYITRQLGAYYLVGAFVVGLAAVQLQKTLPELTSHKLIGAMELFAGFFIPFYFFKAGLHLERENFSLDALGLGVVLVLIAVPLKIVSVVAHRRIAVAEPLRSSLRIGLAIVPTLVFTLVLADILRTQYALDARLFGALMIYTFVNTAIPGFILRVAPPEVGAGLLDDAVAPPAT